MRTCWNETTNITTNKNMPSDGNKAVVVLLCYIVDAWGWKCEQEKVCTQEESIALLIASVIA